MVMSSDVFVVMDGARIGGVYRYREDATMHAQACGGSVVVQPTRNELPGWVRVMVDEAKEKARMQSGGGR